MRLDLIANVLDAEDFGVIGTSIFTNHMPFDCQSGILLRVPLTGIGVQHELPGYFRDIVQLIIREKTIAAGDVLAARVVARLTTQQPQTYNEIVGGAFAMRVNQMLPQHLPIRFPRSEGGYTEWSINFDVSFVLPV